MRLHFVIILLPWWRIICRLLNGRPFFSLPDFFSCPRGLSLMHSCKNLTCTGSEQADLIQREHEVVIFYQVYLIWIRYSPLLCWPLRLMLNLWEFFVKDASANALEHAWWNVETRWNRSSKGDQTARMGRVPQHSWDRENGGNLQGWKRPALCSNFWATSVTAATAVRKKKKLTSSSELFHSTLAMAKTTARTAIVAKYLLLSVYDN